PHSEMEKDAASRLIAPSSTGASTCIIEQSGFAPIAPDITTPTRPTQGLPMKKPSSAKCSNNDARAHLRLLSFPGPPSFHGCTAMRPKGRFRLHEPAGYASQWTGLPLQRT